MTFEGQAKQFLEAWNTADPGRLSALLSADVRYSDAHFATPSVGPDPYVAFMLKVRSEFPQMRFHLEGVDDHGVYGLIAWRLSGLRPDSSTRGFFFARLDPAGRFSEVVGFSDPRRSDAPMSVS